MGTMPERTPSWSRREQTARRYQPKRIRLLLLGESPRADDRFFYSEDDSDIDDLFLEIAEVFFEARPADGKIPLLKELRRRGVFFVDLKPDAPRRGETLGPYVAPLSINLGILGPEKIVIVHPDVYDAAFEPLQHAGLPVVDVRVPRLDPEHPESFRQKLRQALVRADLEKLIRPLGGSKGTKKPEA
jgi:hypothetical protein